MSNEFENKPNVVLGVTTHGAIHFNNNGTETQPNYEPDGKPFQPQEK